MEENHFYLTGKILINKTIEQAIVTSFTLTKWNCESPPRVSNTSRNVFLFTFRHKMDLENVLKNRPWMIMGGLLILSVYNAEQVPDFSYSPFWVRAYGLPLDYLTDKKVVKNVSMKIGGVLGIFMCTDLKSCDESVSLGSRFIRVKVILDVGEALKTGFALKRYGVRDVWIEFKYEELGVFCYKCGRIGHDDVGCRRYLDGNGKYGPWLRVDRIDDRPVVANTVVLEGTNQDDQDQCTALVAVKKDDVALIEPSMPKDEVPLIKPSTPKPEVTLIKSSMPKAEVPLIKPSTPKAELTSIKPSLPKAEVPVIKPSTPKAELTSIKPSMPKAEVPVIKTSTPKAELTSIKPSMPKAEVPVIKPSTPKAEVSLIKPSNLDICERMEIEETLVHDDEGIRRRNRNLYGRLICNCLDSTIMAMNCGIVFSRVRFAGASEADANWRLLILMAAHLFHLIDKFVRVYRHSGFFKGTDSNGSGIVLSDIVLSIAFLVSWYFF